MNTELITKLKDSIVDFKTGAEKRIDTLEQEIVDMKTGSLAGRMMRGTDAKSFASVASKSIADNLEQLDRHGSLRLEVKAAGDLITTGEVGNTQNIGLGAPTVAQIGLQYAMRNIQMIGASSIEYSRYQGFEGGVTVQAAEGNLKTAVRGDWLLVNQPSITAAGYCNISRQALHDSNQLRGAIQSVMNTSLSRAVDTLLWSGSVGLFVGFYSLSTLHHSTMFTSLPDCVAEAIAVAQNAGSNPSAVVVSPSTWVAITTAKATGSGEYLTGSYLGGAQMTMHGLPVILSLSVPSNRAVLVDSNSVELVVTQNPVIEANYVNDGFIRNQATLLIETRVAPVLKATAGVIYIVPQGESV